MPKLHFLSACTGFIIAGLLALTTSQASPPPTTLNPASIRVEYMPHPRDMVQIKEGAPYTVPVDKLFVLTALGSTTELDIATLSVDGGVTLRTQCTFTPGDGSCMKTVPTGLTVGAGSVLSVFVGKGHGRAWGYLASE